MKTIAFPLLVLLAGCSSHPLTNTSWIEQEGNECPDAITFEATTYTYLNDCYALGTDAVIEVGRFAVHGQGISLSERKMKGPSNFEYWPQGLTGVQIVKVNEDELTLQAGSRVTRFKRR